MKKEVGVSLLSADWSNLKKELARIKTADHIHFDVMDGHFVPNLSYGPKLGEIVRRHTRLPVWSHLMVTNPEQHLAAFASFSQGIIVHVELQDFEKNGTNRLKNLLIAIKKKTKVGLALNPETPVRRVAPYLHMLDAVLVMSVHPGSGGQQFIRSVIPKFKYLREQQQRLKKEKKKTFKIMVDGGINLQTKRLVAADVFVAGSYVMHAKNAQRAIASLRD